MTNKSFVGRILSTFDYFSMPVSIFFRNDTKHKSLFGGVFSIIVFCLIMLISIYLLLDLVFKNNQKITKNYLMHSTSPDINISLDYKEQSNFFFFSFYFRNTSNSKKLQFFTIETVSKYLDFEIRLTSFIQNSTSSNAKREEVKLKDYNLVTCKSQYYFNATRDNILIKKSDIAKANSATPPDNTVVKNATQAERLLDYLYCINDSRLELKGDYVSSNFTFFSFKIRKCSSTKQRLCESEQSASNFIHNLEILIDFTQYYVDTNKINQMPISHMGSFKINRLTDKIYQKVDFYLSKNRFISEENLLLGFFDKIDQEFISYNKEIINFATFSNTLYAFYFRSDKEFIEFTRRYKLFIDVLSQIGGIWKFIFIIVSLIVVPINLKMMMLKIANSIFNVVPPEKELLLANETYETYSKLGTLESPNEVIKSNGKNALEAQMSIDLFKYQRNCDVDFSIKIDILQKFSLLCGKSRDNRFVGNRKFMEFLVKKVNEKLDIIQILKFLKCLDLCMSMFLRKKNFLVENYQITNDIKYKTIGQLIKYIKNQVNKIQDKIPVETLEADFINGIRYFRNKPVLDPNVDRKLIDRLFRDGKKRRHDKNEKNKVFKIYCNKNYSMLDKSSVTASSSRIGLLNNNNNYNGK